MLHSQGQVYHTGLKLFWIMLKKDTQGSIEDNDGKFTTNFVYNAKKNHD